MTGRHEVGDPVVRMDDPVSPGGGTRRRALQLAAIGVLAMGLAVAGLILGINRTANHANDQAALSQSDITALKQLLADRRAQRDDEQARVQAQLDEQARVLCLAIADFQARASSRGRAILDKAARDLHCAKLANPTAQSSASSSTTRATSAPGPGPLVSAGRPAGPTLPRPAAPAPTPRPTPSPTSSGLLGGVVCVLLPVAC